MSRDDTYKIHRRANRVRNSNVVAADDAAVLDRPKGHTLLQVR